MDADRRLEVEPFFERFFDLLDEGTQPSPAKLWSPALDMVEYEGHLLIRFDLPGIDPKSIDLQLSGDQLTLNGERRFEKKEGATYLQRQQVYGKFSRSLTLPCHVDEKKVRATYENGVMHIELPKSEEFMARQIPIATKSSK